MIVMTLDPKATHINNPDCPSRLAPNPSGHGWYCVDCGFEILQKRVEVESGHLDFDDLAGRMGATRKACHGRPPIRPVEKMDIELHVGEPCDHPGCKSHASHPCEGCGRGGPEEISRQGDTRMVKQGSDVWLEESPHSHAPTPPPARPERDSPGK